MMELIWTWSKTISKSYLLFQIPRGSQLGTYYRYIDSSMMHFPAKFLLMDPTLLHRYYLIEC